MNLSTGAIKAKLLHNEKYKKYFRKMSMEETKVINNELMSTLKVFDEICRENGLCYLVVAGALIGAVRDHNCLPWDDDIDLVMPRPDYERFREIFINSKYSEKYTMIYPEDNNVLTMAAHFYRKSGRLTELIDDTIGESLIYEPFAYLDIVPLDSCNDDKLKNTLKAKLVDAIQMGLISRRCFKKYDPFLHFLSKDSVELRINMFIRKLFAIPFFVVPKKCIFKILDSLLKYNPNSKQMTITFGAKRYVGEQMPREIWLPVSEVQLGEMMVMAPNQPEEYLKHRYGDFMKVPSKEIQEERLVRLRGDWQKYKELDI